MSAHTPSIDGAGCADSCVPCEIARARELDALRDLRALVLRTEQIRSEHPLGEASAYAASPGEWAQVVATALKAVMP